MKPRYDKNNPVMMSAEIFLGAVDAIADAGGKPSHLDRLLRVSQLSPANVVNGDGRVPLHKVVGFLNQAAAHLNSEIFGLLIAKHQPPARFALFGRLVQFAPTLGQAINDAIRFSLLNSEYTQWNLRRSDQHATLIRQTRVLYDEPLLQMQSLAMAVVLKAMHAVCQHKVSVKQVNFALAPPTRPDRFEQHFGCTVVFNQPETSLVLEASALALNIPTADPDVYRLLVAHLESLAGSSTEKLGIADKVRRHIEQTVGSRYCSLESTAEAWGMQPRALQRALQRVGATFRELQLEVRQALAEDYLRHTSVSVLELSDMLGYQNPSAFSRAFKQRIGCSPEHWRRKMVTDMS